MGIRVRRRAEAQWRGAVPTVTEAEFASLANEAKRTCPVSRALAGTTISLAEAKVVGQ